MVARRIQTGAAALVLSLSSLFILAPQSAYAAAVTWDGEGADNNFSTAANWVGDVAPVSGDSIVFPYSALMPTCVEVTLNNDLDSASVTLAGVSFTGSKPADCYSNVTITGNELKVSGDVLANDVDQDRPNLVLAAPVAAVAPLTIQSVYSSSTLNIGASNVTIMGSTFGGGIAGSGALTINAYPSGKGGGGCSALNSGPDSSGFTGSITITGNGALSIIPQQSSIGHNVSSITKESSASLSFRLDNGQDATFDKPITFNGGYAGVYQNGDDSCNTPTVAKTLTISSNVTFSAETVFYLNKANINFTGVVTGKEFIKIADGQSGTISFSGSSEVASKEKVTTVTDATKCTDSVYIVSANTKLVVNTDCSTGASYYTEETPLEVLGTIAGTGKLPAIRIKSGGHIAPGNSPGCLSVNGLAFEQGSTYDFEIGGAEACTGYDQINVTGNVNLGNGTLATALYNNFAPATGQTYTIINNDGTDAVTGTFSGLVQGATFTQNGVTYSISYAGGDGNDVVLTVTGVTATAAAPNTGFAQLASSPVTALFGTILVAAGVVFARRSYVRK